MFARMRVSQVILKTCIEERFVYRGDFAFATLVRFLPIVTQIFLWGAIYGVGTPHERDTMNGYRYPDMVAYYLLAMVGRAFSSMPGLASGIARDVRDGTIKKYLTQPIDMLGYLFWHRVAHKLVYYFIATGPFALIFWLCREYFPGWPDAWTIAAFVVSLLLGFLMGFLLESLISGSQLTALHLHDDQLLSVRSHDSAGLAGRVRGVGTVPAVQVSRLPARCDHAGEIHARRDSARIEHRTVVGASIAGSQPSGIQPWRPPLQCIRRVD